MTQDIIEKVTQEEIICGLIMPISAIENCNKEHWLDVKNILTEAIENSGLKSNLVSDSDNSGVIQKRIVKNIYENEIVVCDVSCKNPNVMFELGMRLAFDKPTVVVMDDKTGYSFDTSIIEHIEYPRDLRYQSILAFKKKLSDKISNTLKASKEDKEYTTFLKHFGDFKLASIENKVGSINDVVLAKLEDISTQVLRVQKMDNKKRRFIDDVKDENKDMIKVIVKNEIETFCKMHTIERSSLYSANLTNQIVDHLEKNGQLCTLCGSREILVTALLCEVTPF